MHGQTQFKIIIIIIITSKQEGEIIENRPLSYRKHVAMLQDFARF